MIINNCCINYFYIHYKKRLNDGFKEMIQQYFLQFKYNQINQMKPSFGYLRFCNTPDCADKK